MVGGRTDIATVPRLNEEDESYIKAEAKVLEKETVLDHEMTERTVRSGMIWRATRLQEEDMRQTKILIMQEVQAKVQKGADWEAVKTIRTEKRSVEEQ
jgi:hypothetical protein